MKMEWLILGFVGIFGLLFVFYEMSKTTSTNPLNSVAPGVNNETTAINGALTAVSSLSSLLGGNDSSILGGDDYDGGSDIDDDTDLDF